MKKIICLFLILSGGLILFNCGSSGDSSDSVPGSSNSSQLVISGQVSYPEEGGMSPAIPRRKYPPTQSIDVSVTINGDSAASITADDSGYYSVTVTVDGDSAEVLITAYEGERVIQSYSPVIDLVRGAVTNVAMNVDTSTTAIYRAASELKQLNKGLMPIKTIYQYIETHRTDTDVSAVLTSAQNVVLDSLQKGKSIIADTEIKSAFRSTLKGMGRHYYQFIKSNISNDSFTYFGISDFALIADTSGPKVLSGEITKVLETAQYSQALTDAGKTIMAGYSKGLILSKAKNWLKRSIDEYSVTLNGNKSGTMTVSLYDINLSKLSFDSVTAVFNNFSESQVVYNGTLILDILDTMALNLGQLSDTLGLNIADSFPGIYNLLSNIELYLPLKSSLSADSFSITNGDSYIQFKGRYTRETDPSFSEFSSIIAFTGDINNSFMIEFDTFVTSIIDTNSIFEPGGNKLLLFDGLIKHSEMGSIELDTVDTFSFAPGSLVPSSGTLVFIFGNGKIRLTVIDKDTVKLEYAVIDDMYVKIYEGSWSNVLNLLKLTFS